MSRHLCALIVLAVLFGTTPVWAAQLARPNVEYSADSVMQTEEGTIEQHVYVTPTKERREMLTGSGDGAVQIFRHDSKVMWQLMPSEKMYMEHKMGERKGNDPSQWDFEETVMGEETLNGIKVIKYKTIATSTDGKKYGGFSWRTKEGISIKSDLLYKEGNEKSRMMTELKNVKIGRQDPKMFEIPEGYTKFDMAGMMGGMMGREGMGQRGMPNPRPQTGMPPRTMPEPDEQPATSDTPPTQEEPSTMDKASNFMKGLFGQ
ncbi:DUF4412 domain-containing protein [Petrachloros mirabilis]